MVRWKNIDAETKDAQVGGIAQNLWSIWNDVNNQCGIWGYGMGGRGAAHTTVPYDGGSKSFSTKDQMHSEMVALSKKLDRGDWQLHDVGFVYHGAGCPVPPEAYSTDAPHCGYCTVLLQLLRLPLGVATQGRFNQAVNLEYRLPDEVRSKPALLARLLAGDVDLHTSFLQLKHLIDTYVRSNSWALELSETQYVVDGLGLVQDAPDSLDLVTWNEFASHRFDVRDQYYGTVTGRDFLWKLGFEAINRWI